MNRFTFVLFASAVAASAGCSDAPGAAKAAEATAGERLVHAAALAGTTAPEQAGGVVSNDEAQRQFRQGLAEPRGYSGGATSRDELVQRFMHAVQQHDTAAVREMVMGRAEFAYLYYPHTQHTRPPYELEPALLWFMIQQNSEKGIVRVLRRYGGAPLQYTGHRCEPEPELQGPNRLWNRCVAEWKTETGEREEQRLFGSIIEQGGRFKFVSYSNDL